MYTIIIIIIMSRPSKWHYSYEWHFSSELTCFTVHPLITYKQCSPYFWWSPLDLKQPNILLSFFLQSYFKRKPFLVVHCSILHTGGDGEAARLMPKTVGRQQVPLRNDAIHVRDPEVYPSGHQDCRSMGERRYKRTRLCYVMLAKWNVFFVDNKLGTSYLLTSNDRCWTVVVCFVCIPMKLRSVT